MRRHGHKPVQSILHSVQRIERRLTVSDPRLAYLGLFPHPRKLGNGVHAESKYFPTWGDMVRFAAENKDRGCKYAAQLEEGKGYSFFETPSFEAATKLALEGWEDGLRFAEPLIAVIVDKVTSLVEVEHVIYDVEGIGLDVATYLSGEPECWQRFESYNTDREGVRHMRLVVNASASGGIGANVIKARGAAIAAMIQGLEFAGCRVQLEVLACCAKIGGKVLEQRVLVKSADQDLDMSRAMFAVAHPSMLRRIGFAIQQGCPVADSDPGYGRPDSTDDCGDLYIDSSTLGEAQWENPDSAAKWVIQKMKEQGVKFTEV